MAKGEDVKARMNLMLQESQKRSRLEILRKDTMRKVDFIRRKTVIEYHDVYHVIRDFFKEFLERRYEFTMNELRGELKKVYISNQTRQQITPILDSLEAIEYATVHYAKADLVKILDEFSAIVEQLVHVHTNRKPLLERVRAFFMKESLEPQTIIAELPVIEETDAYHVRIYTLVEKCYIALDRHNMHRAKLAYKALIEEYNLLDDIRKQQYYTLIEQTYKDILSRASMVKE